jgi:protein-tyrosine-phosphatase
VFLSPNKVARSGKVIGIDMTDEMLEKARKNAQDNGYTNVEFRKGDVERRIPVEDNTADLVISNCVINLTADKVSTFKEVYRILKHDGGRMMISDLVTDREVDEELVNPEKWCSCIDGTLTKENYLDSIRKAGFKNVEVLEEKPYIDDQADDKRRKISSLVINAVRVIGGSRIMKLLFGKSRKEPEIKRQQEKTVLFVCVQNAGRSQIAEAFFRKYTARGYMTVSGGTRPAGEINPIVVKVMKEFGIDISKQKSKILTEDMIRNAAIRVNMGCMDREACPALFIHNIVEWGIEDPKGKSIEQVREIKDEFEQRVRQLAADLAKNSEQIKL